MVFIHPMLIKPIGTVHRLSSHENERDLNLTCQIIVKPQLLEGLEGIDGFSHIYVIFWINRISRKKRHILQFQNVQFDRSIGVFATRSPIHPNPIGLTIVELVKQDRNVLWVKGLDALDGTPIIDLKPYPDWEQRQLKIITEVRIPEWLKKILI